ncbi:MAG: energy transducer TonB, partial [Vicinamibacterales bacterium]
QPQARAQAFALPSANSRRGLKPSPSNRPPPLSNRPKTLGLRRNGVLRIRSSLASIAVHAGLLLVVLAMMRVRPVEVAVPAPARPHTNVVWIANPEVGGGGHHGGDRTPLARKAAPKPVPAPRPRPVEVETISQPPIAAVPLVAEATPLAGAIEAASTTATTRGPGLGDGPDTGKGGTGSGPGRGPGSGDGDGYRVGNGVSAPRLIRSVKPQYTADAMRARISGSVWLECVVDSHGGVDRCRLTRSLDPALGLDEEAIKAARQWRFEPGIKGGEPVPVQVTIELAFSLR